MFGFLIVDWAMMDVSQDIIQESPLILSNLNTTRRIQSLMAHCHSPFSSAVTSNMIKPTIHDAASTPFPPFTFPMNTTRTAQ